MFKEKRSFFERITGSIPYDEDVEQEPISIAARPSTQKRNEWIEEEVEEGELTVDVYQSGSEVVIQTMIAGVRPEDLEISVTREMITIKGKRDRPSDMKEDGYIQQELYWGSFSRTVMLPAEVESEEAEAVEKHGLLTVRLPKIDKERVQRIKIKSI